MGKLDAGKQREYLEAVEKLGDIIKENRDDVMNRLWESVYDLKFDLDVEMMEKEKVG